MSRRSGDEAGAALRRVVLTGAESTGKSTLAAALAAVLGWPVVPEAARVLVEQLGRTLTLHDLPRLLEMHRKHVAEAHVQAVRSGASGMLLDTDLVSSVVYARHYLGAAPDWLVEASRADRPDLYVLCQADFPFEPEHAQRGTTEDQAAVQQALEGLLQNRDYQVLRVHGTVAERAQQVSEQLGVEPK